MDFSTFHSDLSINKLTINQIKKLLISRELKQQILAVNSLFNLLKENGPSDYFYENIINADIVEMLCEASCTTNVVLLQTIFKCFSILIRCNKFFEQHRSTHALESILRALYIISKTEPERDTFISGFQLICDVICRSNSFNVPLISICNVQNIINLIKPVYKSDSKRETIYAASEVVLSILHSNDIDEFKIVLQEMVFNMFDTLIHLLTKFSEKKCVVLIAEFVNATMRFLADPNEMQSSAVDTDNSTSIFRKIFQISKEVLTPYLLEIDMPECDGGLVKIILTGLLSIYHFPKHSETGEFSQYLLAKGFFTFLPLLETRIRKADVSVVIRSVILELLVCLSNHILGKENWRTLLSYSIESVPILTSFNTIYFDGSNEIFSAASIVFNYFRIISASKLNVNTSFLRNLCKYVLYISDRPSVPLMKAIWFIFSVTYLTSNENNRLHQKALQKVIYLIKSYKLNLIYSHHPSILYWSFCDYAIPHEVRTNIIILWMERDDEESKAEMKSFIQVNKEACFLSIDIMAVADIGLSKALNKTLRSLLAENNNFSLLISDHAWSILPQLLTKYCSSPEASAYESLSNLINLCCDVMTNIPDQSLILRISCLLPGAFSKYLTDSYCFENDKIVFNDFEADVLINSFKLACILLHSSVNLNDKRVAVSFLGHEQFLKTVELAIQFDDDNINTSALKLLTYLIHFQNTSTFKSSKVINLDVMKLLKLLRGESLLCLVTLKFLAVYLETFNINKGVFVVSIYPPNELQMRALYLHIHMICAKSDGEAAALCWLCLKRLLELSDGIGLKMHLAANPYTPTLLLKATSPEVWKEAMSFISVWLPNLQTHSPKALNMPLSLRTLGQLTDKLVETTKNPAIISALNKILQIEPRRWTN